MAVNITNEELDLFNKNGFTDDDVRATVENYRSQGLDDNAIRAKVQSKLDSWSAEKQPVEQTRTYPKESVKNMTEEEFKQNVDKLYDVPQVNIPQKGRLVNSDGEEKSNWFENIVNASEKFREEADQKYKEVAKEKLEKREEWEKAHPFISGIQKDYQPNYRADVEQWKLDAKYGMNKPLKEALKTDLKKVGLNLVPSTNIAVDIATGGSGTIAKQGLKELVKQGVRQGAKTGVIGGLTQGVTSSLADNGISTDLLLRPLSYATAGLLGGSLIGGVAPIVAKPISSVAKNIKKPQVVKEVSAEIVKPKQLTLDFNHVAEDLFPEQVIQEIPEQTGKMKKSTLAQKTEKTDEVAQAVKENPPLYEVITNAETTAKAQSEIAQDMGKVHADIVKKLMDEESEVTALDVEKARQLFGELQKQGRFDEATSLLELTSKQGSKLGQAVQAFSLWSKTTPDGAMLYAQKLLDKYNKGVKKKLQRQLTEKELREIGDAFQKLNESGLTGRELEVETAKAMKKVFKVVPKTFAQKLEGYRYINMLLSGKSRIKDFLLTAKNASDIAIDEAIAGGIDIARSALSKDKTRYVSANPFVGTKAWFGGAKKGLKEGVEDVRYGMNTSRSGEVGRYGLPNNPTFEEQAYTGSLANKALTFVKNTPAYAEKLLRYSLQVPDRMFFEARFASSIANQMKARGLKEPTEDMINSALKEAKKSVYQEDRPITKAMLKGAELFDVPIHALEKNIGLPQGTLPSVSKGLAPFVKTPTNVIAQGAEGLHGLGSGYFQLRNAIESGNPEAIRQAELLMGRGFRGLGELGLGLAIGKGVWDNVKTNVGNKDYYANEITGLKPSSVAIGDKGFSLQNMQTNLPIVTGIGLGQGGLGQAWTNTADVIAEMPALKALGDLNRINKEANYIAQSSDPDKELVDKGTKMLRSLGASYLSSLVPVSGFLGELRNDIDPYARELYVPKGKTTPEMLTNATEYVGNRIINRLPFASETLPIKYNSLGEPVMINNIQNPVARVLSEAVDFGVRNYNIPPQEMAEMQRLKDFAMENDLQGKTTLTFDKPKRYIGRGKDRIDLTNEQYSELTRLYNSKVYEELQFLMNTPEYLETDEETQIKWVKEVLKEKKKEAEDELFDIIK
jgi:energy-coupling factor transporter ATP-binding protein EcfA2